MQPTFKEILEYEQQQLTLHNQKKTNKKDGTQFLHQKLGSYPFVEIKKAP